MSVLSSLTNRIFVASAVLVIGSIAVAVYFVNVAVTEQANAELRRGLDEASSLTNDYVSQRFDNFVQIARSVADLPKLKAAVDADDPPTVAPVALDYQRQIQADLFVVTGKSGRLLASVGPLAPPEALLVPMLQKHSASKESAWFWSYNGGLLRIASIPLAIRPGPELLGTLVVGFRLDRMAARIKELTNTDLVILHGSEIDGSTLDRSMLSGLSSMSLPSGVFEQRLGGDDYIAHVQPLGSRDDPVVLVLRSRTERLRFLSELHRQIAVAGLAAVLVATLLGYAIARTVTRPLRAVTATMKEIASTGDLARHVPEGRAWEDEDARLLATTLRQLTTALDRFQREAAQRERLSSLGRLSTVVAHEVRNPLMIIKAAARSLRKGASPDMLEAADSIDEEVQRINTVVTDVLDFARPIRFAVEDADLSQLCRDAAHAARSAGDDIPIEVHCAPSSVPISTDPERLRGVLVNVLSNAQQAVRAKGINGTAPPAIELRTTQIEDGRWRIEVCDRGVGISTEDLPRVFEPFFTTKRGGSGLGLALARNVVEGLGGTISVRSRRDVGTTVRIDV
jgi:signal transduction histidine kinase